MKEKVSTVLKKHMALDLDESVECLLDKYCTFDDFQKNSIVINQGDNLINLYFIIKGLVRAYYIDKEGNDITKNFAAENDFFSTKGLICCNPSLFYVECLENCRCIRIPYIVLNDIMEKNENIYKVFSHYIFAAMEILEVRTRDLVMKSAEERYIIFLEQYYNLEPRINQRHIASYIGIKTGSLSRIKKQIRLKN